MSKFVISTLTAPVKYTGWLQNNGVNTVQKEVLVQGGAGIALTSGAHVRTPQGVQTEVSDEDAAFLASHQHFKDHMKGGFVKICDRSQVPDKAAKDMAEDKSRPKTDKDVAADNKANDKGDGTPGLQAVGNKKPMVA